ncbi:hypothetical protein KJE20_06888 [Pyrenophora tritici-repentis]|uniref:Uncharacterized protein n=2 Tax=Pyrenophora tritici-repentis TaxID=45151 RepID=A0A922SX74_9PLEO|nr:hypothetical protein Ptr86124_005760 [Pyrenophora tritici-repentis]KAI1684383.1 hypothetical protein KJE20_06888 [Pyrenophora tritici-repentis]
MSRPNFQNSGTVVLCAFIYLGITVVMPGLIVALLQGFFFGFLMSMVMATWALRGNITTTAILQAREERIKAWQDSVMLSGQWTLRERMQ